MGASWRDDYRDLPFHTPVVGNEGMDKKMETVVGLGVRIGFLYSCLLEVRAE